MFITTKPNILLPQHCNIVNPLSKIVHISPEPVFLDSYEEKALSFKTTKVLVSRRLTRLKSINVWVPNAAKKLEDDKDIVLVDKVTNIFEQIKEPIPTHKNTVMRVNIFAYDENKGFTSLLTQPILIDSQLKECKPHNFNVYIKPNYSIQSGTIIVLQREYFKFGDIEFPNLVTVELN
jgi:hypothetical protein